MVAILVCQEDMNKEIILTINIYRDNSSKSISSNNNKGCNKMCNR